MKLEEIGRSAIRGVVYSQWAYWCSLAIAAYGDIRLPHGAMRDALILTPALTEVFCVVTTYWLYKAYDEYLRLQVLKSAALTAIVVAFVSLGAFFLPPLGRPGVGMLCINLLGWSVFNLQLLYIVLRK